MNYYPPRRSSRCAWKYALSIKDLLADSRDGHIECHNPFTDLFHDVQRLFPDAFGNAHLGTVRDPTKDLLPDLTRKGRRSARRCEPPQSRSRPPLMAADRCCATPSMGWADAKPSSPPAEHDLENLAETHFAKREHADAWGGWLSGWTDLRLPPAPCPAFGKLPGPAALRHLSPSAISS